MDGKSTAVHAAVLAPDDVKIFTYPCIPDYEAEENVSQNIGFRVFRVPDVIKLINVG